MKTMDRMWTYLAKATPPGSLPLTDRQTEALAFICSELDEIRQGLIDEGPTFTWMRDFLKEWATQDPRVEKSKLQFLAERVVGYDKRFAELHKRLDEWDKVRERLNETISFLDRIK